MESQEVFDRVVIHLRKQGCPSIGKYGGCKYRNELGLRCAVGSVIENSEYSPRMEGHVLFDFLKMGYDFVPSSLKERLEPHASLLTSLMRVHDYTTVNLWEASFQGIAKEFKLNYVAPEKVEHV